MDESSMNDDIDFEKCFILKKLNIKKKNIFFIFYLKKINWQIFF